MSGSRSHPGPVAVIDVGSNSIKLLVAAQGPAGNVEELTSKTLEVRIGSGIGTDRHLNPDSIERAVDAVARLVEFAAPFDPASIRVVATSAVRDAVNGDAFADAVQRRFPLPVEVLSEQEEARLVCRGATTDPALTDMARFFLFDLGGGSLELIDFDNGATAQWASLPLGCVRLTEMFAGDPLQPIATEAIVRLREHVREHLRTSSFSFVRPAAAAMVLTGGTVTTLRAVRAARTGEELMQSSPRIAAAELESWAQTLSSMPAGDRTRHEGLSGNRADVIPAGLWTLVELAAVADVPEFTHSLRSLRYGLAAEALGL